jgi:tetratricopeptide (TPR) repeat protein
MNAVRLGVLLAACVLVPAVAAQTTPGRGEPPVTEVRVIGLRGGPADSLEQVGLIAYSDGVLDDAEEAFIEAILASGRGGGDDARKRASLAQLHSNLAWLYYEMGRFGEADSVLRHALALDRQVDGADGPTVTRRTVELAMLNQAAGRYQEAGRLLDQVIALHARNPKADPREVAFALHLLARNYHATGNSKESERIFKNVLDSLDKDEASDASLWATTMLDLAELYHASHRDEEARDAFSKAVTRANQLYAAGGLPNALVLNPYSVLLRRAETVRATGDSARR